MRVAAAVALAFVVLVVVGVAGFYAWIRSESTDCGASFGRHEDAVRAALRGREAGFDDVEVEPAGFESRKPTSRGAGAIYVSFDDGETSEDAASLRHRFREIVRLEDGKFPGCDEQSRVD